MTVKEKQNIQSQKVARRAFRAAKEKAGQWPSLGEIAAELKVSKQRAAVFMDRLIDAGKMVKVKRYRGYRLVRKARKAQVRRKAA